MSTPVILWIVIAAALAILYAYRTMIVRKADDLVHLSDASDVVLSNQEATARTIQQLDRIAVILAIVLVVYGLALGCWQVYTAFTHPNG